jgi:hypothetical protein
MTNPNIVNVTSIYGTTAVQAVANTLTALVTNSTGSGSVYKVDTLILSNNDTSGHTVTIDVFRASNSYPISKNVIVPVGAMYDVLSKFIYLNENDILRVSADTANVVTAVCSYEVIS